MINTIKTRFASRQGKAIKAGSALVIALAVIGGCSSFTVDPTS